VPEGQAGVLVTSDEQLVRLSREGDRLAQEELFRRHWSVAYRVAYRLLGNDQDALDAVQDAMLKSVQHLNDFGGRSEFRTWLLRIVNNAALDLGRKRKRLQALRRKVIESNGSDPTLYEDPGRDMQRSDLRRKLDAALNSLSPTTRATFVLSAEAELSYKQIAECQGLAIGTVMSRLHYARRKLQLYLEDTHGS
jgi:RNA polymerase sigma-70 factor, ECF subfamily